jgi:hypothetical protein
MSFTYWSAKRPNGVVGLLQLVATLTAENEVQTTANKAKNPFGSPFRRTHTANLAQEETKHSTLKHGYIWINLGHYPFFKAVNKFKKRQASWLQ